MRAAATPAAIELGITLNLGNAIPASDQRADREAARRADGLGARIYLDPLLRGAYPADVVADLAARGVDDPDPDGDLEIITAPIDVLGVNYYTDAVFSGVDEDGTRARRRRHAGRAADRPRPAAHRDGLGDPAGRPDAICWSGCTATTRACRW